MTSKERYYRDPEKHRINNLNWRMRHKDQVKEMNRRRRYENGNQCPICGKPITNWAERCRKHPESGHGNRWKGGITKSAGRVLIWYPQSPMSDQHGYVLRSRIVMANTLERDLSSCELVHHINGNTMDDRPENLELSNRQNHAQHHMTKYCMEKRRADLESFELEKRRASE